MCVGTHDDAELRYDRAPVGALQGLAPDLVLHGGSVSKSLAPALRLGWLVVPRELVAAVVDARRGHDVTPPVVPQLALASLLEDGSLVAHVRRASAVYAARRRALLAAVTAELPGWSVTGIDAGLHAVLAPPAADPCTPEVHTNAARGLTDDVGVVALHRYCRGPARRGLVVGFGDRSEHRLRAAVARLAAKLAG